MSGNPELTIASVYHSNLTKRLIELNHELVTRLNPTSKWAWLVGDNSLPDPAFFGAPYYPADYAKYRYFPAASFFVY